MPAAKTAVEKPSYAASIRSRERRTGTSWEVRFRLGSGEDSQSTSRAFDSEEKAQRWRQLLQAVGPREAIRILEGAGQNATLTISGEPTPASQMTVRQFAEYHFTNQTAASDGTVEGYRRFFRNGLKPLADIPVGALTRTEVIDWVKYRSTQVQSKTVKNEHNFLSTLLKRAQMEGAIVTNPAHAIPIPRSIGAEMTFLTPAEFGQLMEVVPDRWKHVPLLLAGTGLR